MKYTLFVLPLLTFSVDIWFPFFNIYHSWYSKIRNEKKWCSFVSFPRQLSHHRWATNKLTVSFFFFFPFTRGKIIPPRGLYFLDLFNDTVSCTQHPVSPLPLEITFSLLLLHFERGFQCVWCELWPADWLVCGTVDSGGISHPHARIGLSVSFEYKKEVETNWRSNQLESEKKYIMELNLIDFVSVV